MKKKHVPAAAVCKSELESLRDDLTGNQTFAKMRGKLSQRIDVVLEQLLDEAESPSDFLRKLDDFSGNVRVLANKLAILRRDGHVRAEEELMKVLQDEKLLLHGETVPLHKTVAITVIMIDIPKTLEWDFAFCCTPFDPTSFVDLQQKLNLLHKRLQDANYSTRALIGTFENSDEEMQRQRTANGCPVLGYMLAAEQSDVLKLFSREEQDELRTWQLRLPTLFGFTGGKYFGSTSDGSIEYIDADKNHAAIGFGFYKEADHDRWHSQYPSMTSFGVSGGYGIIVPTQSVKDKYGWHGYSLAQELREKPHFWLKG